MPTLNECHSLRWPGAWHGKDRGRAHTKPKTSCSFFRCKRKYPVEVALTLSGDGSALGRLGVGVQALGRLGIGVQVLGNSQARGWGDTSNSILHPRLFGYRGVRGLGSHF